MFDALLKNFEAILSSGSFLLAQAVADPHGAAQVAAHGVGHSGAEAIAAGTPDPLLGLIPLLPLIGAVVLGLLTMRPSDRQGIAGWIATGFAACSFAVSITLFNRVAAGEVIEFSAWRWFEIMLPSVTNAASMLTVEFAFRLDKLAAVMLLVVTGVGSLIHLYAVGYMLHDSSRARFFCYLNLFLCAMLLLVLGENLLVMFVGWEGVGLCSYLLIGFWYKEMPNAVAGQKAFVVNRIGDAGFILGMFLLIYGAGTVQFTALEQAVGQLPLGLVSAAALLLFVGAMGKSAQIPLYVWLPDAMAGPTPVSALIHAATMVTAGVYMVTRMSFLYVLAPQVLAFICIIGTLTAFTAATIALAQTDIKKVLAYSTVSQLGFMFMALGAGAFSNGIFHVVTHAFFKACLFMSAGAIIVACHHEQDMRKYGGLWEKLVCIFAAYLSATLAISGFPGFSGFYSKDAILWAVYSAEGPLATTTLAGLPLAKLAWGLGTITAFMTAFYMTRSLVMTFAGEYRGDGHHGDDHSDAHGDGHAHDHHTHDAHAKDASHPHVLEEDGDDAELVAHHSADSHGADGHDDHGEPTEARTDMRIMIGAIAPLVVLSIFFSFFYGNALITFLTKWTRPDMLPGHHGGHAEGHELVETCALVAAVGGILLASLLYLKLPELIGTLARSFAGLHRALINKWYVDELYDAVIVRPLRGIAGVLFTVVDRSMVDAIVNGTWMLVGVGGDVLRRAHSGRLSSYVVTMLFGTVFLTLFWIML